jgi:hypothetical protein
MAYSQQDIFDRIKVVLPTRWFGEDTPLLDSVLNSLAAGWIGLFDFLDFVQMQTRISTATDGWLDLIAEDFFGHRITRRQGEADDAFRVRISRDLLQDKCTRKAIFDLLLDLTGRPPVIFEPSNPGDTGCYSSLLRVGTGMAGYGASGGWGNLNMPFQAFVTAFRPEVPGIGLVNGWGGDIGGYGSGFSAYVDLEANSSTPGDFEMYQSVSAISAAGTIIWMSIRS